ncbi:MAG: cytochrome c3 family protein [Polyangiaceae bacterium]
MSRPTSHPPRRTRTGASGWLVLAACASALLLALLQSGAAAQPPPAASAAPSAASAAPAASGDAAASSAAASASPASATAVPAGSASPAAAMAFAHGVAPTSGDAPVPNDWLPPGSKASPVPSDEIFPPQQLTIRFNHKKHVQGEKQTCKSCHKAAYDSLASGDSLLPNPTETCDNCHYTDHSDLKNVTADTDPISQCTFCHLGADAGKGGKVAPLSIPKPNLIFPHKKHLDRNVQCGQCHGKIEEVELATRDFLPRMSGCFTCHQMSGASQGDAKSDCDSCHVVEPTGKLAVSFGSGMLLPPSWLHNAAHTADWIERHKTVAADDSAFCASCHTNTYCADCHDGKVRNRKVHPNDWLSMHPQAARQDNPRCTSCHAEQTFCADCHRRVGVARDSASGNRLEGRRFHPPSSTFTTGPRSAMHHSWEAERNLNACVSCHTERDCATCHATKGVSGGQGVNPHPVGFANGCASAFERNPRPCLVCHQSGDAILRTCK